MLRKTVARAFGEGGADRPAPVSPAPNQTRREDAAERLFQDLLEAFERAEASLVAARSESPDAPAPVPDVVLRRPRPRAGGVELTLEGPAGAVTVLNTLTGRILVVAGGSAEGGDLLETLSVHRRAGSYRPIRKPALADGSPPPRRTGRDYRYTSVSELVREYIERVAGVHKIDTRTQGP